MQYVAFLRGINVGGKGMIKMSELKEAFETCKLDNVRTFINSGNVLFETEQTDTAKLSKNVEDAVLKTFDISSRTIVVSHKQLLAVSTHAPSEWKKTNKLRCYIAFIKEPYTPEEVISEASPREGVDFIEKGPGVVYMTTRLEGLTKSGFTKLAAKKCYKYLTIRNYTTVQKIQALLE